MDSINLTSEQLIVIGAVLIWVQVWKAIALWISAGRKDRNWFIIFIVFNTLGILEMLYIFVFSKKQKS